MCVTTKFFLSFGFTWQSLDHFLKYKIEQLLCVWEGGATVCWLKMKQFSKYLDSTPGLDDNLQSYIFLFVSNKFTTREVSVWETDRDRMRPPWLEICLFSGDWCVSCQMTMWTSHFQSIYMLRCCQKHFQIHPLNNNWYSSPTKSSKILQHIDKTDRPMSNNKFQQCTEGAK